MTQPIYKVYLFKPTEAWYQLNEQDKKSQRAKVESALKQVGGKEIISCFSGWNSEQWLGWGVEQFPDTEAVQKHHTLLVGINWFRYFDCTTYLGTEVPKP
jgi:hypothetical protein